MTEGTLLIRSDKLAEKRKKEVYKEILSSTGKVTQFDYLFEDSKRRREHKDQITSTHDPNCVFKPSLKDTEGYCKILSATQKVVIAHDDNLKPTQANKYTFHPKVGRPPMSRNEANKPIGDYLFSKKSTDNCKNEQKSSNTFVSVNSESAMIVERVKTESLRAIFKLIDKDHKGVIATECDISHLPADIIPVVGSIIHYLQSKCKELNEQSFVNMAKQAFIGLTPDEKRAILIFKKAQPKDEDIRRYSFSPSLNKKSVALAERKSSVFKSTEDRWKRESDMKSQRVSDMVKQKMEKELEACTFKPNIMLYSPIKK